jgi:hypothetical protein
VRTCGRTCVALVALVCALISPETAFGAWPPQGQLVGDGAGIQAWSSLSPDGEGGALVSWVGAVGDTSAFFLQRFAPDGTIQPGWPSAVLSVIGLSVQPSEAMNPFVWGFNAAPDHSGGAFLTWLDFDSAGNLEIRLIRVTGSGQIPASWPAQGVLVMGSSVFKRDATMVKDGLGGAFVGWADLQDGELHARVQRYTADGQVAPGWPAGGARPHGGSNSQEKTAIRADGSGGVWIGWVHSGAVIPSSAPSTIDYTRVVHHVTAAGVVDPALPPGGIQVSGRDPWAQLGLVEDPTGGVFAVWRGSDLNQRSGLFVQRLTAAGTPAPGWPATGVRYTPGGFEHWERAVTPDGEGGLLSSWGSYESGSKRLVTRAQRVQADGTIPAGWDTAGVAVRPAGRVHGRVRHGHRRSGRNNCRVARLCSWGRNRRSIRATSAC